MKRSAPLLALSRDHHGALSLALRIRRSVDGGDAAAIAAMAAKVVERFHAELKPHFADEERWLLPLLTEAGASALATRTLAEHAELAGLVDRLAEPAAATLSEFADCLTRHVRFEERELFEAAGRFLKSPPRSEDA